jgi:nitrite reductase (cytochrome c-552)
MSNRSFLFLVLAALTAGLALMVGCSNVSEPTPPSYKTSLDEKEVDITAFKPVFPLHYETYLGNNEDKIMTEYGGSVPYDKHDNVNPLPKGYKHAQPYLKNLWMGYPFSFEYRAARGHTYAMADILQIDRISRYDEKGGLPSTCYNCKTTKMTGWVEKEGDAFWAADFNPRRSDVDLEKHGIGCPTCHNPKDMSLRLYSVPLQDAMKKLGLDWDKATRSQKRALVCGQCHVEYYFQDAKFGAKAKPIFPWTKGFDPENMYEYYKDHGSTEAPGFEGWFADWTHAVSKTPMLKAQHPEYEMWVNGPHGAAGVSCADCHMAYVRMDGKKKISSHTWASPLKTPDGVARSCGQCHQDKTPEYLKQRVLFTQKKVFDQLLAAQDVSVKAHEAIRLANEFIGDKDPDYANLVIQAKERCRKAQFFWDLVSAENSVGFHNPAKALDTLASSQRYSQEAVDLATRATKYATAPQLAGDIRKIVPPIMEHSRKLQQSKEHLASHKWLTYLPQLPQAEMIWNLNQRLVPAAAPAAPAPAADKPADKKS